MLDDACESPFLTQHPVDPISPNASVCHKTKKKPLEESSRPTSRRISAGGGQTRSQLQLLPTSGPAVVRILPFHPRPSAAAGFPSRARLVHPAPLFITRTARMYSAALLACRADPLHSAFQRPLLASSRRLHEPPCPPGARSSPPLVPRGPRFSACAAVPPRPLPSASPVSASAPGAVALPWPPRQIAGLPPPPTRFPRYQLAAANGRAFHLLVSQRGCQSLVLFFPVTCLKDLMHVSVVWVI